MKGSRNDRTWALGTAWLAVGLLVGGCTNYRPLDAGSRVPWAEAMAASRFSASAPRLSPAAARGGAGEITQMVQEVPLADLSGRVHRVERGEALVAIAERYGVRLGELAAANDIGPPYTIFVGQMLRIPSGGATPRPIVVQAAAKPSEAATVHVVRRGETLSGIARRYGVPIRRLAQINAIRPPYDVRAGTRLDVPAGGEVQVASRADREPSTGVAPVPASLQGDGFLWPVNGKVVGRFGQTEDGQRRDGIDIAARKGAPVRAAKDGVVVYAGDAIRGYGRMILLRHEGDYLTTYAHNTALLVNVGDRVARGQVIARTGERLHFELRKGRKPVDPETLLVPLPTEVASSG